MNQIIDIHEAFKRGDLDAVRAALADPASFPNDTPPPGLGTSWLEYAIYWSPVPFIIRLLDMGADPNYEDLAGFPSLIAALSSGRSDTYEIVELLLARGADTAQRGVNDFTPLHWAASEKDDPRLIDLLARCVFWPTGTWST